MHQLLYWLAESEQHTEIEQINIDRYHACNAAQLAKLLTIAALMREESRGAHYRSDYPHKNDWDFHKHILHRWGQEAVIE